MGTLLDGAGDAFDQSALMVALLNQAALSNTSIGNAGFLAGTISLTNAQAQSWLGVDNNPNRRNLRWQALLRRRPSSCWISPCKITTPFST